MTRPEASLSTSGCTSPFVLKEARTPDVDPGLGAMLVAVRFLPVKEAQLWGFSKFLERCTPAFEYRTMVAASPRQIVLAQASSPASRVLSPLCGNTPLTVANAETGAVLDKRRYTRLAAQDSTPCSSPLPAEPASTQQRPAGRLWQHVARAERSPATCVVRQGAAPEKPARVCHVAPLVAAQGAARNGGLGLAKGSCATPAMERRLRHR